jgi:hypothetical protein
MSFSVPLASNRRQFLIGRGRAQGDNEIDDGIQRRLREGEGGHAGFGDAVVDHIAQGLSRLRAGAAAIYDVRTAFAACAVRAVASGASRCELLGLGGGEGN